MLGIRIAALAVAVAATSGCITVNGAGRTYLEPSIPRGSVRVQSVAILPNRLPINLQDPERWRRYNWSVIRRELIARGIRVVDYRTSLDVFARSGLPVEDTKSSRDKYAEVAQQLGVDAIIVPYYGTFGSSQGAILIDHHFTSVATLQVYLAAQTTSWRASTRRGPTPIAPGTGPSCRSCRCRSGSCSR